MKDNVQPNGKWVFDKEVADSFDDMLERSIPQYHIMRKACLDLAKCYIKQNAHVVDLGCSRGEAVASLVEDCDASVKFTGVDISAPMVKACKKRFSLVSPCGRVSILNMDLRKEFPTDHADVILSILVLQFIPIEYRQQLVSKCYDCLRSGGALIVVEKVLGSTTLINQQQVDIYYQFKEANGYTKEDITRKRLSLEGVLVPVTALWNESLLRDSGFSQVDCFWRWMNFAGWVAVK